MLSDPNIEGFSGTKSTNPTFITSVSFPFRFVSTTNSDEGINFSHALKLRSRPSSWFKVFQKSLCSIWTRRGLRIRHRCIMRYYQSISRVQTSKRSQKPNQSQTDVYYRQYTEWWRQHLLRINHMIRKHHLFDIIHLVCIKGRGMRQSDKSYSKRLLLKNREAL